MANQSAGKREWLKVVAAMEIPPVESAETAEAGQIFKDVKSDDLN